MNDQFILNLIRLIILSFELIFKLSNEASN